MPDIREHTGQCRFANCTHTHEPGCSVQAAVQSGLITPGRYRIYADLLQELEQAERLQFA
jgi:ribosome biogenesis GTPase